MPPRKELCRNFQRGSCQYGDRCKFLHVTPQQSKPTPFESGVQNHNRNSFQQTSQQQEMRNPFGFGVQNNSQSRGGNAFGSRPNQFKPFENKWSRFSSVTNNNSPASQQDNKQTKASEHECTDPESCKRQMAEDFQNDNPQWKLTCYGHGRYGPCDITGDISYEELRALAYEDAKSGKSVQHIIDRERSLLSSKLAEFQNLLQKPNAVSSFAAASGQNPFGLNSNGPNINNNISTPFSSFSDLGRSLNTGTAAVPSYTFGQSSTIQNNQPSSFSPANNLRSHSSGAFGSQPRHEPVQKPFSFGSTNSSNNTTTAHGNPFATFAKFATGNVADAGSGSGFSSHVSNPVGAVEPTNIVRLSDSTINNDQDDRIWKKTEWKWNAGEIPEVEPPDIYIH